MTAKKPSVSAKKELTTTIKQLRSKLDRADHEMKRLKSKAARLKKNNTELETQVKNLKKANKRLEKASTPALSPTVTSPTVSPDASWTVVQLRAEARTRGLPGLSRKTKAELLAALG